MNSFAHVFDPHSSYFSPRNSEEYRIQMSLSYEGIGASLQIDRRLRDDHGHHARAARRSSNGELKATDRIIAVGQGKSGEMVDVVGWRLDDVVAADSRPAGLVRAAADPARQGHGGRGRARARAAARQDHPRGAGRQEGTAHHRARRPQAARRRDHGAVLLPGLRRAHGRRRRLPQHHPRRAEAAARSSRPRAASTAWCSTCARTAAAT